VRCPQVKRAETHLLNRLFQHVHDLSEPEMKRLLEEDEMTLNRRAAAKCAPASCLPACLLACSLPCPGCRALTPRQQNLRLALRQLLALARLVS
jgi:hypothetical protein